MEGYSWEGRLSEAIREKIEEGRYSERADYRKTILEIENTVNCSAIYHLLMFTGSNTWPKDNYTVESVNTPKT